ncbi:hypothetical protein [Corynebacterium stationis]|uniref:hypothetical protein n=1 Tax=Corynebacterium stationis TaxID=1705 RepID=UPI0026324A2A|nr:hypothetical protein [Corynebacterium stationis]
MSEELDRIIQPAQPVDDQNKDPLAEEVVTAWSVGMGRNEIARTLQISRYRVSKIADEYGLEFNAEATQHATKAHAEYAQRDRAELEARFAALAHTELDKAEEADDDQSRFIHIRNAAISADKSIALADSAHKLNHGVDDAEEGNRLVSIQMGLMMNQAERVREIMQDPTPSKPQPSTNDPFGHLRAADDEPS